MNRGLRETCPETDDEITVVSAVYGPPKADALIFFFLTTTASHVHIPASAAPLPNYHPRAPLGQFSCTVTCAGRTRYGGSHHVRTLSMYKSVPSFCCYPYSKPVVSLPLPQPTPLFIFPQRPLGALLTFANAYITMYKLTWIFVAFFALCLSVLAAPVSDLEKRITHVGRVRVFASSCCSWC